MEKHFEFTQQQYNDFNKQLKLLKKTNWGIWQSSKWLTFKNLPAYTINQYEQDNGIIFLVVKFDSPVKLPDGRTGKRFKYGGSRNYKPIVERF